MASEIRREDLTEFLAACHRHDVPADAKVAVETKADNNGVPTYFRLVATKTVEAPNG